MHINKPSARSICVVRTMLVFEPDQMTEVSKVMFEACGAPSVYARAPSKIWAFDLAYWSFV